MMNNWTKTLWTFLLHFVVQHLANCQQVSKRQLVAELLSSYSPYTRPVQDASKPLNINMSLAIREVIGVSEKDQTLTTSVWVRLYWYDEFLRWDPEKEGGISTIYLPVKQHWKPDVVLFNNAAERFGGTFEDIMTPITASGLVTYMYPAVFKTTCNQEVRNFPFDQQQCRFSFMSWAYDGQALDLKLRENNHADTDSYVMNTEWVLVNMTGQRHVTKYGCCPVPFPSLEFVITLRRRETPYIFYLVYPNIIINLLTVFQFLLPCDSGERVTLGITTVLSLVVYLLLMAEMLPMSEQTPLIGDYFAVTIFMVGLSLVLTFIVLHLHHNGLHDNEAELPHWARHAFLHTLASMIGMRKHITSDVQHEIKMRPYQSEFHLTPPVPSYGTGLNHPPTDSRDHLHVSDRGTPDLYLGTRASVLMREHSNLNFDPSNKEAFLMCKIVRHLEDLQERLSNQDKEKEVKCEWQQVAMVIDRLLFYIYLLATCLVLMSVFLGRPHYRGPVIK